MPGTVRENLLGYLLGALESDEEQEVRQALVDQKLRRDLEVLELRVAPLREGVEWFTPPSGLVSRTCELIAALAPPLQRAYRRARDGWRRDPRELVVPPGWSIGDLAVTALVLIAFGCLLFPSLLISRTAARDTFCEHHAQDSGQLLVRDSAEMPTDEFPTFPLVPVALPQMLVQGQEAAGKAGTLAGGWSPSAERRLQPLWPRAVPLSKGQRPEADRRAANSQHVTIVPAPWQSEHHRWMWEIREGLIARRKPAWLVEPTWVLVQDARSDRVYLGDLTSLRHVMGRRPQGRAAKNTARPPALPQQVFQLIH